MKRDSWQYEINDILREELSSPISSQIYTPAKLWDYVEKLLLQERKKTAKQIISFIDDEYIFNEVMNTEESRDTAKSICDDINDIYIDKLDK